MHKLKTLALVALAAFGLTARGAVTTNDWWDVSFEPNSFQTGFPGLIPGQLGSLTNNEADMPDGTVQPYAAGVWTMVDGDESYITNGLVTNFVSGAMAEVPDSVYLKLDTQGNDLTWSVVPTNQMGAKLKALVDADLYLVGSDSAPDAGDFDSKEDVQTAVYLMNEINPDSGETTNSVLCVYVYDSTTGENYWQPLAGEKLEDNAWAHVQVLVDHTDPESLPSVKVYVNGTEMHAHNGAATSWPAANGDKSQTAGKVSSVAFRGTGAVDNFVGKTIEETFSSYDFTAEVYMNDTLQEVGTEGNVSRVVNAEAGANKTAKFEGFNFHDLTIDLDEDDMPIIHLTYSLAKIEIINLEAGTTSTFTYAYDREHYVVIPSATDPAIKFEVDPDSGAYSGPFSVEASTAGATADSTIVKIYFEDLPEPGTYNAQATTTLGGTTTTDSQKVKPSDFTEENPTKTITWTFDAEKNGNVLSTIQLYNGATLEYANKTATVTVTTNAALQADTLFAAATYVTGSLAEGQDLRWSEAAGLYTFEAYVPPVAIIVAGNVTNEYPSLLGAITNATAGDTIYLVADDHVSFTEDEPEIMIADISLTIDGNGHTLYGLTDYGTSYHDIFIGPTAGNVTIKNLKFTEFGDTAAFSDMMTPIVTSGSYAGMLTLDGVTIDKFIRQAVLICGGDFLITNCTITGSTAGTEYFQSAIEVFNATGTVVNTTITGIGAKGKTFINPDTNEEDEWKAAVFTIDPAGFGKITVESGSYTGEVITSFNKDTTGSIVLVGGTFVATAEAGQSAFLDDSETGSTLSISGGWFDREPAAAYVAAGLTVVQDADNAPDPAATWTVKAAAVQIEGDTTKSYLSIAEAQAAAATAGIDDPVFVIVAPLSAETVTLATAEDTLTVKTDDTGYLANLEVVTSLAGSDAVEYAVEPRTVGLEPPITVTYMVVPTYYVAKIVDGETTTKYGTFTAAATVAMAQTPTLVVEMVANTNAQEDAFAITGSLKVKAGEFLIPELVPEDRSHYLDASEPDENGVVTYTSTAYLKATFLNGDGSTLQELDVKVGGVPVPTFSLSSVEPYPPAQPGYVVHFAMTWTPALGPISVDTVFRPNFTTNVMDYSIQYVLDGGAWPAGYTPPEWYAVTNATIELPSPVKDGWTFNGWYTNKTEGVYVGDLVNPGTIPTGSYGPKFFYASWTENAVEVKVDAGDGLAQYKIDNPQADVPKPIEINSTTGKAEISFVAPAAGRYVLFSSTTVNGTYTEDAASAQTVAEGDLVTLTEGSTGTTKFFKIGYGDSTPEP